jgi:hypothetical protein
MTSTLKSALLAVAFSAAALLGITQALSGPEPALAPSAAATELAAEPTQLRAFERGLGLGTSDEQRLEQSRLGEGGADTAAVGICSITCRRCTSDAGCPPITGEPQTCVFGRLCP